MNARDHAFEFLLPIDSRRGVRAMAKRIWHIAEKDETIAAKFRAIQDKLGSGKPILDTTLYERLKDYGSVLDLPTAPEPFRPIFVAAYLRAKAAIATGSVGRVLDNLDETLDRILAFLDKGRIEESFGTELLTETVLAAREDPAFAKTLREGAAEFRALANELYGPDGESRPAWLARASTGGGGSCTCCTTVNGQRTCEPCSCWIIVIVIIIIVVTK
jgi:hypothetical protein